MSSLELLLDVLESHSGISTDCPQLTRIADVAQDFHLILESLDLPESPLCLQSCPNSRNVGVEKIGDRHAGNRKFGGQRVGQ